MNMCTSDQSQDSCTSVRSLEDLVHDEKKSSCKTVAGAVSPIMSSIPYLFPIILNPVMS